MTILTLPTLVVALWAQLPMAPGQASVALPASAQASVAQAPIPPAPVIPVSYTSASRAYAPPPVYQAHNPPPAYQAPPTQPTYRPYHRSYRRSSTYRKGLYADDYLKKGGGTVTFRGGYHDLTGEPGAFRLLQPWGSFGYGFGWNLSPFVHFGLGVEGLLFGQRDGGLGPVKSIAQINVISDVTFRLIRPSERRYLVPFLQVGLGLAFLTGSVKKTVTTEGCDGIPETTEKSNSVNLARGGLFQVGGGLEIFLTHFVSFSVRALYRAQPMSGLRCLEGAACDPATGSSQATLHGFVADAALTFHFGSL